MASIRKGKRGGFDVLFRFGEKQYSRHLPTENPKEAEATRKLVEVTLHDLQTGRLVMPPDCQDVGAFIISGGKVPMVPAEVSKPKTVRDVVTAFLADALSRVADGTMS